MTLKYFTVFYNEKTFPCTCEQTIGQFFAKFNQYVS